MVQGDSDDMLRLRLPAMMVCCLMLAGWCRGADEDRHAFVKFHSFRDEIDSEVFESLSDFHGCLRLMREIGRQPGFVPQATWLVTSPADGENLPLDCGTIQGVMASDQLGGIQNVGLVTRLPGER